MVPQTGIRRKILMVIVLLVLYSRTPLYGESLKALTMDGLSMMPTLMPGDIVVIDTAEKASIDRDTLAGVRLHHGETLIVKRIVAIPGDRLEVKRDLLTVNGVPVRSVNPQMWETTLDWISQDGGRMNERSYLVIDDNPMNSLESRRPGVIGRDRILGPVVWVFSHRPESQNQVVNLVPGE